jgi:hypothetical protein
MTLYQKLGLNYNIIFGQLPLDDQNMISDYGLEIIQSHMLSTADSQIITFPSGKQFPGALIRNTEWICEKLQTSYWKNNIPYEFNKGKTSVCIHIRRGDITEQHNSDRWKSNSHYLNIINDLKKVLFNPEFFIISEGEVGNFEEFKEDCTLILNGSDINAFHMLASADVLVTGQSTFSTIIAYINKGKIIYTPCLNFTLFDNFGPRFTRYDKILE